MSDDACNPDNDPFKPPAVSVEVGCLHCGETYDSYKIEWRVSTGRDGKRRGFWVCPVEGCDGAGFGFDIFPTDPNYDDGTLRVVHCDDDDEDDDDEDYDGMDDGSGVFDPDDTVDDRTGLPPVADRGGNSIDEGKIPF